VLSSCVFGREGRAREVSLHQREATLTLDEKQFGSDVAQPLRGRRGER
jgi:hypothetical protein